MNKRASNRRRIYSSQEHASIGGDSSQLESLKPIAHSDEPMRTERLLQFYPIRQGNSGLDRGFERRP